MLSGIRTAAVGIRRVASGTSIAAGKYVPSLDHDRLVDLLRERPDLGRELLRASLGIELAGETFEVGSIDLSQVAPVEYRADAVIVARDEAREVTAGVIVEIQL